MIAPDPHACWWLFRVRLGRVRFLLGPLACLLKVASDLRSLRPKKTLEFLLLVTARVVSAYPGTPPAGPSRRIGLPAPCVVLVPTDQLRLRTRTVAGDAAPHGLVGMSGAHDSRVASSLGASSDEVSVSSLAS